MNARMNMCLFSVSMSWLGLPGGSVVKSHVTIYETRVWSLGQKD